VWVTALPLEGLDEEGRMFRHVVLFRWSPDVDAATLLEAVQALQLWGNQASEHGAVSVGTDAGLREGNWDVAVVAEFTDPARYESYAADPRHLAMLAKHITPNAADRAAVQSHL